MTPDDVRMTAQLVVDKRVSCVSDAAVEAMARRVLELEAAAMERSLPLTVREYVVAEREACAELARQWVGGIVPGLNLVAAIRARGAK